MKSYLNEQEANNSRIEFPVLMRSVVTGNIVLFTDKTCGTVVYIGAGNNSQYRLGTYSETFINANFSEIWIKHDGTVYLKN